MKDNNTNVLSINNEVVIKIASMAALEVEGVADMGVKPTELKSIKSYLNSARTEYSKSIGLVIDNGALLLDVFINVKDGVKLKSVAEAVQQNVKEKVQSMTGNAVARVNVHIEGVELEEAADAEN